MKRRIPLHRSFSRPNSSLAESTLFLSIVNYQDTCKQNMRGKYLKMDLSDTRFICASKSCILQIYIQIFFLGVAKRMFDARFRILHGADATCPTRAFPANIVTNPDDCITDCIKEPSTSCRNNATRDRTSRALSRAAESRGFSGKPSWLLAVIVAVVVASCTVATRPLTRCDVSQLSELRFVRAPRTSRNKSLLDTNAFRAKPQFSRELRVS